MDHRSVARLVGDLTSFLGVLMAVPLGISACYRESDGPAFLVAMVITLTAGLLLRRLGARNPELSYRECFAAVTLTWVVAAAAGALPFMLSGSLPTYTDSFFEAMSGLTTTGATVIADVDAQPHGILFWRAFMHWLGGMGIIVLFIAVLPSIGAGAIRLYRAEVPGPVPERLEPKIRDSARTLWLIYLGISAVQALLLSLGGMSLFDSITHTFATMGTGGFSTRTASIAAWRSPVIQWTIAVFMFIAGGNFTLYYRFLRSRRLSVFRDAESAFYLGIIVCATVVLSVYTHTPSAASVGKSICDACFQAISIMTTTGFTTVDFDAWPPLGRGILFVLMFIGGCTGSTGGGMKALRILVILKHAFTEVFRSFHPRAVTNVKVNGIALRNEVLNSVMGFVSLYMFTFVLATLVLTSMGVDLVSSASGVAATLGNVGPGLGVVGPSRSFLGIPLFGKWVFSLCMLLGRLEIYTVLALFVPGFWRRN